MSDNPDDKSPAARAEHRVAHYRLVLLLAEAKRLLDSDSLDLRTLRRINTTLHPILTRTTRWLREQNAEREHPTPRHDTRLTDFILTILRGAHGKELSVNDMHNALSRNRYARDIHRSLAALEKGGWIKRRYVQRFAKARPAELWHAVEVSDTHAPPQSPYIPGMFARPRQAAPTPPVPVNPPIWGNDDDPRVIAAKQRWLARQRGEDPRRARARAETPARPKSARWT